MPILFGDHPRPCGEKLDVRKRRYISGGSPPPMRGKGGTYSALSQCGGITPAHAGKRRLLWAKTAAARDHPRPCGEKQGIKIHLSVAIGSPPPMRGKVRRVSLCDVRTGITPAHAGKSSGKSAPFYHLEDHPRPCGEKFDARKATRAVKGSPPPMRGKEQPSHAAACA